MAKSENQLYKRKAKEMRIALYNLYTNKYYNIFLDRYKFPELDYEQEHFLLSQFWFNGTISAFLLEGSQGASQHPQGLLILAPVARCEYNIYNFPVWAIPVNTRGVKFIPARRMKVNEEIVIGFCQKNHESVKRFVKTYVDKIVDVEMVIRANLFAHKMPWLIGVTPEDKKKMEALFDKIMGDEDSIFVDLEDVDKLKTLLSGAPYIIDKLYSYKASLEDELREYLGFENRGTQEKKEHLITTEVESNNEITEQHSEIFFNEMKIFCDNVSKVLGFPLHVELNKPDTKELEDVEEDEEEEDVI